MFRRSVAVSRVRASRIGRCCAIDCLVSTIVTTLTASRTEAREEVADKLHGALRSQLAAAAATAALVEVGESAWRVFALCSVPSPFPSFP